MIRVTLLKINFMGGGWGFEAHFQGRIWYPPLVVAAKSLFVGVDTFLKIDL